MRLTPNNRDIIFEYYETPFEIVKKKCFNKIGIGNVVSIRLMNRSISYLWNSSEKYVSLRCCDKLTNWRYYEIKFFKEFILIYINNILLKKVKYIDLDMIIKYIYNTLSKLNIYQYPNMTLERIKEDFAVLF